MSCLHGNPIGGCDICDEVDASFEAGQQSEHRRLHEANQELLDALKGMIQLDEENHQRGSGDIDICKEVQDAYAAIAKHGGAV